MVNIEKTYYPPFDFNKIAMTTSKHESPSNQQKTYCNEMAIHKYAERK